MKLVKKILALVLVAVMMMAMGITAFADGTDGKVTIENATVGVTYKAYKVFDATYNGDSIAYTVNQTLFTALGGTEGTDLTSGPFTISGTKDSAGNFNVRLTNSSTPADTIASWIDSNLTKFTEVTATSGLGTDKKATGNTVEFGNLAYGYYYVTSGLGTVVTIDSAKSEVTIKDKNSQEPEEPAKVITAEDAVIDGSDETGLDTAANDAAVGTTQSFKVTYNATNWVTKGSGSNVSSEKVTAFNIEDQPTNMTIDSGSINVTVGATQVITNGAVVNNTQYPATVSVASGDAGKLSITITWVDGQGNSIYAAKDGNSTIPVTLTYKAVVLASAATQSAKNAVTVTYNRSGGANPESVGGDTTTTDTYHFTLKKVDANDTSVGLKGAKFELTLGTTKVSFIDVKGDGSVYRVAVAGETGATTTIDMKENTSIEIQGLDKKDYTLTEIEAPKGYNLLTSPYTVEGSKLAKATESAANYTLSVENNAGTELPTTGGIGTTIFYIMGSILVLGAGVVLVTRRRIRR